MTASPPATARTKTRDERYAFRGYWSDGGVCRLRMFEGPGCVPVVLCTELPENANTSITHLAECLAAEVLTRFLAHRRDEAEPLVWIEHYPARSDPRGLTESPATFDRVTFASWKPVSCRVGGTTRFALGEPDWIPMTADEVSALIGANPEGE